MKQELKKLESKAVKKLCDLLEEHQITIDQYTFKDFYQYWDLGSDYFITSIDQQGYIHYFADDGINDKFETNEPSFAIHLTAIFGPAMRNPIYWDVGTVIEIYETLSAKYTSDISVLRKRLEEALEVQDYEEASVLRDKINELSKVSKEE